MFEETNLIILSSKCLENRINSKYPSTEKEIMRICSKCTMQLYSTVKDNINLKNYLRLIKLENIVSSDICQA